MKVATVRKEWQSGGRGSRFRRKDTHNLTVVPVWGGWVKPSPGTSVTPGSDLRCRDDHGVFPEVTHLGEEQI